METKKGTTKVDKEQIETRILEIDDICGLSVEVGTNGLKGGNTVHGSRTVFRLCDNYGSDMRCCFVTSDGEEKWSSDVSLIKIAFGGDAELENFIKALDFAVCTLGEKIGYTNNVSFIPSKVIEQELLKRGYQVIEPILKTPADNLTDKERSFKCYIIDLINMYHEKKSLRGMSQIREKYNVSSISVETFFKACLDDVEDISAFDTPSGEKFIKSLYVSACKKQKSVKRLTDFE